QRRSRGEDDIIGFIQCEAYASNGVFEEYPRASNKPIAVGIGEIKFNNVDPIDSSPPASILKFRSETAATASITSAHHGYLVPPSDQPAGHFVGANTCRALGRREMLMKI